jgi:FMN phosphatase YigB (HAD superfamily)
MSDYPSDKIFPENLKLILFDVDGTLYNHTYIRRRMMTDLFLHLATLRLCPVELRIIKTFRKEREKHQGYASERLEREQYEWCANALNLPVEQVERCIRRWMYTYPLNFLARAKFHGLDALFQYIHEHPVRIAIYSDLPVNDKMKALQLHADETFCSIDPEIGQLKPSKKGLAYICRKMHCTPEETLYIGDRIDTDEQGASNLNIPFLLVDKKAATEGIFYTQLLEKIKEYYG